MNDHDGIADGNIGDAERVMLQQRMVALEVEHRDLDQAIARFDSDAMPDELQIRRLKRRKLLLKDQIARLRRQLDPDVPA
mgnify:CR=1 FL=1